MTPFSVLPADGPIWPAHFPVDKNHARDVLAGSYDLPYNPETPPVVIDIGGNIGAFVRFAVKRWPGCTVHTYEPHPSNYIMLESTIADLHANVYPHPLAVSDRSGTAEMTNCGMNCGEWSLIQWAAKAHETLDRPVTVIPATDLPKGDVLKIDAEGSELMILGSLKERVAEFSAVMVEVHSADWVTAIKTMLSRGGFVLVDEKRHGEHRIELKWMKGSLLQPKDAFEAPMMTTEVTSPLKYEMGRPPARCGAGARVPAKRRRVLVAIPASGGMPHYIQNELSKLARFQHPKFEFDYAVFAGFGLLNLSRNVIADTAIRNGHDILVQIDNDHLWNIEEHLLRILSHNEPIVGGLYCRKQQGIVRWVGVSTPGATMRDDGLLQADFLGTGFLKTDVSALKTMVEKLPERAFLSDEEDSGSFKEMTELFPVGVVGTNTAAGKIERLRSLIRSYYEDGNTFSPEKVLQVLDDTTRAPGRLLGEDYGFSHLARKCGLTLWLDTKCIVPHVGNAPYPITTDKLSIPAGIPTHVLEMAGW